MNVLIKTENLVKTFNKIDVTKNVDAEIYEGDFTVIMGSSGSGKSTILYLLSGLDYPSSGRILYDDVDISMLNEKELAHFRRKHIGFVFQSMHLVGTLTVLENLTVPGGLLEKNKSKLKNRAEKLLEKLNVIEHKDKHPSQLSGGEQQRVALARALINKPKVLFADEPTGALNSSQGENVLNILTSLHEEGQSVVMVTHDIKAAIRASRLLFLKDGKIDGILTLPPYDQNERKTREQKVFTFLKEKGW